MPDEIEKPKPLDAMAGVLSGKQMQSPLSVAVVDLGGGKALYAEGTGEDIGWRDKPFESAKERIAKLAGKYNYTPVGINDLPKEAAGELLQKIKDRLGINYQIQGKSQLVPEPERGPSGAVAQNKPVGHKSGPTQ